MPAPAITTKTIGRPFLSQSKFACQTGQETVTSHLTATVRLTIDCPDLSKCATDVT